MVNTEYFRYILLDKDGILIKEMFNVEKCSIRYTSFSRLKQNATLLISLELQEKLNINNKIQVVHHLNGEETIIGTFLISTPIQNLNQYYKEVEIICYSSLWLLEANKTTKRFKVSKGTNVVNEIIRLLDEYGMEIDIEKSLKATSTDREWEIGTPILDICNDLLASINYTSLYVNAYGAYIARPYIMPEDRKVEFEYNESDENNILEQEIQSEIDLFNVPNVFVKYVNNPDAPIKGMYENINPQSPISTANRPRNVHSEEVQDAADIQTLIDMCKRDASNVANQYHKIKFNTAINSKHGYLNSIYINLNTIRGRFIETAWDMECITGGTMSHEAREVIIV